MMKRILVATDLSPRSDRALLRAKLIAKRTGANITLVHVVDADQPGALIAAESKAALSVLEDWAQTLGDDEIQAEVRLEIDDVQAGIIGAAEKIAADLIVIGAHRSRLSDVFTGTTVERVVRRSRFPLLVAVQPPSAPYQRTLLAVDFDEASKAASRAALAMNLFTHTEVVVMHAFDTPAKGMLQRSMEPNEVVNDYVAEERGEAIERLRILSAELGLPPSEQRVEAIIGSPASSILKSAKSTSAQLIVVGTNQRKGLQRLLIGSVTEEVIREASRDVLIVPIGG